MCTLLMLKFQYIVVKRQGLLSPDGPPQYADPEPAVLQAVPPGRHHRHLMALASYLLILCNHFPNTDYILVHHVMLVAC